jgi:hypothetical protein
MDFITDQKLEEMLQRSEPPIGDDDFSKSVLSRLPERRSIGTRYRGWTLAGAAAMGSFLTLLLAPPIESTFSLSTISNGYHATALAALLLIALVAIPTVWVLCSQTAGDS